MKVDEAALRAILVKVERARDHLLEIDQEVAVFRERQPYRFVHEIRANGAKHIWRVVLDEPIPVKWAVLLGEAVHDLRSALDQSVYWLTVDYKRRELEYTGFPVFTRRLPGDKARGFADMGRGGGLYMIRGIGPGPAAFIEGLQPYPQRGGPIHKSVLALHEFWNQDKHRLVHLFGIVNVGKHQGRARFSIEPRVVVPWIAPGVVHDGAIIFRVTCDPPQPDMKMSGTLRLDMAVKHPGKHRRQARVTLRELWGDIALVVSRLLWAVGRQDEAVPLGPIQDGFTFDT